MLLEKLKTGEIVSLLKQYFTDGELDEVSSRLEKMIDKCDTLDDLVTEINDQLIEGQGFIDSL
jgi:ribosome assembly protein YihI (activator of Der GTPase)